MEGVEVKCPDANMNLVKFENINKSVDKIMENQVVVDRRLTILEQNNLLMAKEFSDLKTNQDKQSILMLDLDRIARENNQKQFEKILTAQSKIEESNDLKLNNMVIGQTEILNTIVQGQNIKTSGSIEITKAKLGIILTSCTGAISIILFVLEKVFG